VDIRERTHGWIEETTADTEEDPSVHGEREAEYKGDVEELNEVTLLANYILGAGWVGKKCDLCACKCKE
jgi:hypothetical protein